MSTTAEKYDRLKEKMDVLRSENPELIKALEDYDQLAKMYEELSNQVTVQAEQLKNREKNITYLQNETALDIYSKMGKFKKDVQEFKAGPLKGEGTKEDRIVFEHLKAKTDVEVDSPESEKEEPEFDDPGSEEGGGRR